MQRARKYARSPVMPPDHVPIAPASVVRLPPRPGDRLMSIENISRRLVGVGPMLMRNSRLGDPSTPTRRRWPR
jgi:hypothetical protein